MASGQQHLPVNFGDDYYRDDKTATKTKDFDASTAYTNWTSGIDADDPSNYLNERGETRAQEIANSYRGSGVPPPVRSRSTKAHKTAPSIASHLTNMSYVDENYKYYPSRDPSGTEALDAGLVAHAAGLGRTGSSYQELDYGDPTNVPGRKKGLRDIFLGNGGRYPLEQRIEDRKRGIGRQKRPFLVWILSAAMIGVFVYELARNWQEQGTPFSFKPTVNWMLGPSTSALINFGARYPLCMKSVQDVPLDVQLACMNDTANPADRLCSLESICGFGGFHGEEPNQWFRFITPIFLHAGVIHILFNLLAQFTMSAQIERQMGSGGFFVLYFAAGIFGNVLGGNFALITNPSIGASGAIFGTIAVLWVDLIAHWQFEDRPKKKLLFLGIDLIFGVAIGYIPNAVDNFAHLGGFFMGLQCAIVFLPIISTTRRHKIVVWCLRIAVLPISIVLFVILIRNFYTGDPAEACEWCRYLSCFPTSANDHCSNKVQVTSSGS